MKSNRSMTGRIDSREHAAPRAAVSASRGTLNRPDGLRQWVSHHLTSVAAAIAGVCLAVLSALVSATPMNWGEDVKSVRWPDGTKLTFWVPPSEINEVDRAPYVREGIKRWQDQMADRGITINVPDEEPNADTPNLIKVEFKPAGTSLPGDDSDPPEVLDEDNPIGLAGCTASTSSDGETELVGGDIILLDTLKADSDESKELLRNLAAHEVCHVLGLADDDEGSVTRHLQDGNAPREFNDQDKKEIDNLYPKTEEEEPAKADGELESKNAKQKSFDYRFTYVGHDEGHVPLIVMDIDASVVAEVNCPPGWVCLNPSDPLSKSQQEHPFYHNYMTTTTNNLAPWKQCIRTLLAFRALGPESDLRPEQPEVVVGLTAQNYELGFIRVWAGDEVQVLPGPVPIGHACTGDLNGDEVVNGLDLLIMLSGWGMCADGVPCFGNLNGDEVVNGFDLLLLLGNWGSCAPPPARTGPCCLGDGTCAELTMADCYSLGGRFAGSLCTCDDYLCDPGIDPYTCLEFCGEQAPGGCWCDSGCVFHGDCCDSECDACPATCCPWDVTGDGEVDGQDLLHCLGIAGPCEDGAPCLCDFNRDGVIDKIDIDIMQENFGPCP